MQKEESELKCLKCDREKGNTLIKNVLLRHRQDERVMARKYHHYNIYHCDYSVTRAAAGPSEPFLSFPEGDVTLGLSATTKDKDGRLVPF